MQIQQWQLTPSANPLSYSLLLCFFIVACLSLTVVSCASTRYVVYDSTTGKKKIDAKLGGNYGLIPTSQKRGNLGNGAKGGLLPGFNYADDVERTFAEATQPTRIIITDQGMTIEGIVDHSTAADIKGDSTNRAIRNISTLAGWQKVMDTIDD